jgi:predicted methyltransferase
VLTFRNLHNWIERGEAEGALRAFHKALKRAACSAWSTIAAHGPDAGSADEVGLRAPKDYAIALIEKAGFKLAGRSEVNAMRRTRRIIPRASGRCRRPTG